MYKKIVLGFLISSLLVFGACASSGSQDDASDLVDNNRYVESKPTIVLAYSEVSNGLSVSVLEELIESQLRYQVKLVPYESKSDLVDLVEDSEIDVVMGLDSNDGVDYFDSTDWSNETHKIGFDRTYGWFIPQYLLEDYPNLLSWQDLRNQKIVNDLNILDTSSNGNLIISNEDSGLNQSVISRLGLPLEAINLDDLPVDSLKDLNNAKEGFLIATESDSQLVIDYNLISLIPIVDATDCKNQDSDCVFGSRSQLIFISDSLADKSDQVAYLVDKFRLNNQQYKSMLTELKNTKSKDIAVKNWMEEYKDVWTLWIKNS